MGMVIFGTCNGISSKNTIVPNPEPGFPPATSEEAQGPSPTNNRPPLLKSEVRGEATLKSPPENSIDHPPSYSASVPTESFPQADFSGALFLMS